ncbi:membrane protein [Mycobacterium phage Nibb]|uniref:Membrane protein n=1 Tax=Mycobacterium phage Nibb TaxID=2510585 RepID=A0A411B5G2_9CAUD|nr:membrane protein [Mycobacterium phage Nibb]QAX95583.1 membrane protein [Mycobacterium phage Nibb]
MTFAAVAAAVISLLIRYPARRVPDERGATTAVLLLAVGLYLISSTSPIGDWLFPLTGWGYLDTFVGNMCWIGGLVALLHHTLDRLAERDEQVEIFDALLRWPLTLTVPMMLAAMYVSRTLSLAPVPDIGDARADAWIVVYRVLYYGTVLYLAGLLLRVLPIVRRDDGRSCHVSHLYMLAAALIVVGISVRILSYVDGLWLLHTVVPVCRAGTVVFVACGAALSWRLKVRAAAQTQCAESAPVRWLGCDEPDPMRS